MCIWGMLDSNLGQDTDSPQVFVVDPTQYPQENFGPRQLPCRLKLFKERFKCFNVNFRLLKTIYVHRKYRGSTYVVF